MNYFRAIQLATQILASSEEIKQRNPKFKTGDAALYISVREFAAVLEERNPGIVELTGYSKPVRELNR